MARVAVPTQWTGALVRQHGPLRLYQWLWLVVCVVGALAAAAPRILSQPVVYRTSATVQFDRARYGWVFDNGVPSADYRAVENIAINLLKLEYPTLGSPRLGIRFEPQADGTINVVAIGADPAQAQQLADRAAAMLTQSIGAAGGREIYRQLAGWEQFAAYNNSESRTSFQQDLRDILLTSAFPLNKPVDVVETPFTVDQLRAEDVADLARALEIRNVELSEIDLPRTRAALAAATGPQREQLARDVKRLEDGLSAIRAALQELYDAPYNATFAPGQQALVYRSAAAAPGTLVDRRIPLLLLLAAVVGLLFGGVGVAVDRSAGVMPKLRELWGYRELIRNLVLRDLRVRYKGSALGYLWTQLAPLLLMLVFLFVFGILLPSGIAMFSVFLIVGLLPWNFCAEAISGGTRSVLDNAHLVKKVFFPREVLPLVSVLSSMVNFLLSLPMMFLVMAVVQWLTLGRLNFAWTLAYLPVLLVLELLFLTGVVLFLSALAVFLRDLVHLIGILLQFWFFLTPVVYSIANFNPVAAQAIRWLNPMASLIEFYREILYGTAVPVGQVPTPGLPALDSVLRVLVTSLVVLAAGYWFFQRRSGRFGEEI